MAAELDQSAVKTAEAKDPPRPAVRCPGRRLGLGEVAGARTHPRARDGERAAALCCGRTSPTALPA